MSLSLSGKGVSIGTAVSSLNGENGDITITSIGGTVTITKPTANTVNLESSGGGGGTSGIVISVSSFPYTIIPTSGLTAFNLYAASAAVTFNLPATPSANEIVRINDAGNTSGTQPIMINGNGNNIAAYGSATNSSIQINANGGDIWLAWDGVNWA